MYSEPTQLIAEPGVPQMRASDHLTSQAMADPTSGLALPTPHSSTASQLLDHANHRQ